MRQKEHRSFRQEHEGNGAPRGDWLPVRATKAVAGANAVLHQDAAKVFRRRSDRNCVKMVPAVIGKKRVTLSSDAPTPYVSEGLSLFFF